MLTVEQNRQSSLSQFSNHTIYSKFYISRINNENINGNDAIPANNNIDMDNLNDMIMAEIVNN